MVSPYNSDEESVQERVKKRLRSLKKAREAKKEKRDGRKKRVSHNTIIIVFHLSMLHYVATVSTKTERGFIFSLP